MSFVGGAFLAALVVAGVPAMLHLLHRKRFRTVRWAAMDFLLDAVHRQRRWLEFRDLLLMLLRTAIVILFILAIARPYFVSGPGSPEPDGPVHAVLVLDNSLSMAYRPFDATLLDEAKQRAVELVDRLPDGSAVSVVPTCAVADFHLRAAYLSKEDALEAIDDIRVVDRSGWMGRTAEDIKRALASADAIPTKRVMLLGDQQASVWTGSIAKQFDGVEEVQVARFGPADRSNSWIESFRLRDGFAGRNTPAVITAVLRHEGEPRQSVRVTLNIDGRVVAERYVDLEEGVHRELVFEHSFEAMGTPDRPVFVPVSLDLLEDRLPEDDHRWMIAPVVAAAPVVCIDPLGSAEDPALNQYGETFPVRRLLSPGTEQDEADAVGKAIQVRHVTPDEVTQDTIADARLVLVAGAAAPSAELVRLLRSYAEQGGSVVVAAGGWFDADRWDAAAWLDGQGILPLPLGPDAIGAVPAPDSRDVETFRLNPATLNDDLFDLGLSDEATASLIREPFFFKAVAADESVLPELAQNLRRQLEDRRAWIEQNNRDEARWAKLERAGDLTDVDRAARDKARATRTQMTLRWLKWTNPLAIDPDMVPIDELANRYRPHVMLRYDNGKPFAVRRGAGRGQLVFISTGLLPRWNSLATEHAIILIDQMVRSLVTQTIPSRNLGPTQQVLVPLGPAMEGRTFVLRTPDAGAEPRAVVPEAIGPDRLGLRLRDVHQRGVYRLYQADADGGVAPELGSQPYLLLAINGPGDEGELASASPDQITQAMGGTQVIHTPSDRPLTLSGRTYVGRSLWRWLAALTLLLLLTEMFILALPHLRRVRVRAARGREVAPA